MHPTDLAAYFVMLCTLTLAPGPLVLLLMARAMGQDARGAIGFGLGVALGDVLVIAALCLGLGALLEGSSLIQNAGKALLVAYVLWIARSIWTGTTDLTAPRPQTTGGLWYSLAIGAGTCLVSPQTLVLYSLLLPRLVDLTDVTTGHFAVLSLVTFAALATCFGLVVAAAARLRRLAANPRHVARINRTLALIVAGAGIWMVAP